MLALRKAPSNEELGQPRMRPRMVPALKLQTPDSPAFGASQCGGDESVRSCKLPAFPSRQSTSRMSSSRGASPRSARFTSPTHGARSISRTAQTSGGSCWTAAPSPMSASAGKASRINSPKSEFVQTRMRTPSAMSHGASPGRQLNGALQALFRTYDLDDSGSVNLDDFVDAQADAVAIDEGGGDGTLKKSLFVAQYLEARAAGDVRPVGGGLDFEGFAEWQLRWQSNRWANTTDEEAAEDCYRLGECMASRRSHSVQTGAKSTPRVQSRASKCLSARRWPPEVAIAADKEAEQIRQQNPPAKRRFRAGGGMATVRKGFVEPPKEVCRDINAFEKIQAVREESSDDEAYMQAKLDLARVVEEEEEAARQIAQADSTSAQFARELLKTRLEAEEAMIQSQREACRAREETLRRELQQFVEELARTRAGKLTLRGCVLTRHTTSTGQVELSGVADAQVRLQELPSAPSSLPAPAGISAESAHDGSFKLCVPVHPEAGGKPMVLVARQSDAADHFLRLGGQGLRRPRVELLPFTVSGQFKATPDSSDVAVFEDEVSKTRFAVPVGQLTLGGLPYSGQANLSAAAVMPDFGSLARRVMKLQRKDNTQAAINAAVSAAAVAASSAVPVRQGRSLAGSQVPLVLAGAVFVRLTDADSGRELGFQTGAGVDVTLQCHSLGRERIPCAPSIWSFDADSAEWHQSHRPLKAAQIELPSVAEPEAEVQKTIASSSAQSLRAAPDAGLQARACEAIVAELRAGHQALTQQLRAEAQGDLEGLCVCGFHAKQAIQQHFQKHHKELRLAQPPKRLFAGVEQDEDGWKQSFLHRKPDDIAASAQRAAALPDVVLSHHLVATTRLLEPPPEVARDMGLSQSLLFTQQHYEKVWRRVLPHLRHVAAYLVAGAKAIDTKTGQPLKEVAAAGYQLRALEHLVNCWVRPRHPSSAPSTLQELFEVLTARGGDVASALLTVAVQQAQRDETASTRKALRKLNALMWASHQEVQVALQEVGPGKLRSKTAAERAAARLAEKEELRERAHHLHFRDMVRSQMPESHRPRPSVEELRRTLQDGVERCASLQQLEKEKHQAAEAEEHRALQESAQHLTSKRKMQEAVQQSAITTQLVEEKLMKQHAAEFQKHKEVAKQLAAESTAAAEAAKKETSLEGPAERLAEELLASGRATEAADAEDAWKQVLARCPKPAHEHGQPNNLSFAFKVTQPGAWEAVGAAEAPPAEVSETGEVSQVLGSAYCDTEEYFPPIPVPARPVLRTSSVVLGSFGGGSTGMVVTEVACNSLGSCGVSRSQVEPDGTFCLCALANTAFELWFTPVATNSPPMRFGPFVARTCDEATYVGLLEPGQASLAGNWRQSVTPAAAYVSLPRLETCGTSKEQCTCKDAAWLEGNETSVMTSEEHELSKELSHAGIDQ
eukprot:gb/GFBE01063408.1/.p1 GENE.gb/GFBE01063408.1/~~gb/GFBE01063408.1/.p1  ORF type:complete len:1413 (+),score=288.45 gb/GFBE01063408.1/:1-4239(+)